LLVGRPDVKLPDLGFQLAGGSPHEQEMLGSEMGNLENELMDIADSESVETGFQYRVNPEYGKEVDTEEWMESKFVKTTRRGIFSSEISGLRRGITYQFRTVIKRPLLTLYGNIRRFRAE